MAARSSPCCPAESRLSPARAAGGPSLAGLAQTSGRRAARSPKRSWQAAQYCTPLTLHTAHLTRPAWRARKTRTAPTPFGFRRRHWPGARQCPAERQRRRQQERQEAGEPVHKIRCPNVPPPPRASKRAALRAGFPKACAPRYRTAWVGKVRRRASGAGLRGTKRGSTCTTPRRWRRASGAGLLPGGRQGPRR